MIKNERYVLKSPQGFLAEDGFVEDPRKAIKRMTLEAICQVNKDYVGTTNPAKQMSRNDCSIALEIQIINIQFPSPEKHESLSWV